MKLVISLLLSLGLMTGTVSAGKVLPADKIMKRAYAQAAKENKKVMVIFHASWCGWCHRMDSIMNMPETKPFFEKNFVIEHLVTGERGAKKDLDNPGAAEMMIKYNGGVSGIPYWLIFDLKGNLLADSKMPSKDKSGKDILANVGCPAEPAEVAFFVGLLKKTTPLTEDEGAVIVEKFTLKPVKR